MSVALNYGTYVDHQHAVIVTLKGVCPCAPTEQETR